MDDEVDDSPVPAEETTVETARETRGLRWIIGPALLGVVFGPLVEFVFVKHLLLPDWWGNERTTWSVLADGATVGLIGGVVIGALIWAFFPYQGTKRAAGTTELEGEDQ
jgi:hypothetical protein